LIQINQLHQLKDLILLLNFLLILGILLLLGILLAYLLAFLLAFLQFLHKLFTLWDWISLQVLFIFLWIILQKQLGCFLTIWLIHQLWQLRWFFLQAWICLLISHHWVSFWRNKCSFLIHFWLQLFFLLIRLLLWIIQLLWLIFQCLLWIIFLYCWWWWFCCFWWFIYRWHWRSWYHFHLSRMWLRFKELLLVKVGYHQGWIDLICGYLWSFIFLLHILG